MLEAVGAFFASISALPFSHPEVARRLEDADKERQSEREDPEGRPSDAR